MATHSAGLPGMNGLNTTYHRAALTVFMVIVVAHLAEHLAQAVQLYALGWPLADARGVLGLPVPWLVTSEWMHYAYALITLVGLTVLRPGFTGRARTWWTVSLGIQIWHHVEHVLLLGQAISGSNLLERPVPTTLVQLLVPRAELHLFYNTIVFVPMVVAVLLHRHPAEAERAAARCSCAGAPGRPLGGAG
ncbi:hypothetical protein [Sinosporangium siamense]|uniref:Uncharacterized protein n=1 Tax=Sinosporangium siamense TaxID=1367973 RepID=A0A919V737_9ACTN|nr:hypothetical protein [Sinosporangium siamense]GII91682.1 hypothetical protein Ssi02_19130 [Sinosporangium siamense]